MHALLAENLAAGVLIAALIAIPTSNKIYTFITFSIIIIFSQLSSSEVTFRIAPNKKLLDRRRSLGLTFASSVLMFPAFFAALVGFGLTGDSSGIPYATLVISTSLSTYLRYFTTFMYMEISRLKTLIIALSQPVVMLLEARLLDGAITGQPGPILASVVPTILIAEFSVYVLCNRASTLMKIDGLSLSRAFFAGWMGGEPEKLEKVLEVEATREDLEVEVFAVRKTSGGKLKAVMVAPKIHAGPFRNLGSSNLPAVIHAKIDKELHVPAIVFHGAVSHEKDLIYSRDVNVVADEILKMLKQLPAEDFDHGSMITRAPDKMVGGLRFDRQLLVWVSLAPFLSEDLPQQLQLDADTYALQHDLRNASLLDTHSCLSASEPTPKVLQSLGNQIRQIVDKLTMKTSSQLELGIATVDTEGFSPEEIAGLKGVAAFLRIAEDSQGIILFDSNNMTSELRQLLDENLPTAIGAPVEIFTTDTHVLVGIRVKKDYSPIGEKTEKQLIVTRALDALRRAKSDTEPVTISAVTIWIKNAAVLGVKGIEVLGRAADMMISFARELLPVAITGCALLTLLILHVMP